MTERKLYSDLCRCPVFTIIWGLRVSNIINKFIHGMVVRLGESETKRKDCRGVMFTRMRPFKRNVITLLLNNRTRETRCSDSQTKTRK
jgi:hypothetical protein